MTTTWNTRSQPVQTYLPGQVFTASHPPQAGLDADQQMFAASLGDDASVYILTQHDGPTGWRQVVAPAPIAGKASHIALGQGAPGTSYLAVVAAQVRGGHAILGCTSPSDEKPAFEPLTTLPASTSVEALGCGFIRDTTPYVAVFHRQGSPKLSWAQPGDPWQTTSAAWMGKAAKILQVEVNVYLDQPGVYVLFADDAGNNHVGFTSFTDGNAPATTAVFPVGKGATAIGTSWQSERFGGAAVDLLVALPDAVVTMSPKQQNEAGVSNKPVSTAVGSKPVAGASQVFVRNAPDGSQRYWALADGVLHFASSPSEQAPASDFLAIRRGVATMGVTDSLTVGGHDLCAVLDGSAAGGTTRALHMQQAATSSLWTATEVATHATTSALPQVAIASRIQHPDGDQAAGAEIRVTAAARCRVRVDGITHALVPGQVATMKADATGGLTVIHPTHALGTPALSIESASGSARIAPADDIYDALSATPRTGQPLTGKDLVGRKATNSDAPLIPQEYRDAATLDDHLGVIRHYIGLASQLPSILDDDTTRQAKWKALAAKAAHTAPIDLDFGSDGGPARLTLGTPVAEFSIGGVLHDIGDAVEAIGHDVVKAAKAAIHIVEEGLHLALEGVDAAIKFGEQAVATLGVLLKKGLGLALELLADLLDGIFDWAGVGQMMKGLESVVNMGLDALPDAMSWFQGEFGQLAGWLSDHVSKLDTSALTKSSYADKSVTQDGLKGFLSGFKQVLKWPSDAGHWIMNPLVHVGFDLLKTALNVLPHDVKGPLKDTLNAASEAIVRVVSMTKKVASELGADVQTLAASIAKAVTGFTEAGAFALQDVVAAAAKAWNDLSSEAIALCQKLVTALTDAISDVVAMLRTIGGMRLDVPILGSLYKLATGASHGPTIMQVLMFGISAPAAVISRAALGHIVFDTRKHGPLPEASWWRAKYTHAWQQTGVHSGPAPAALAVSLQADDPWYDSEEFWKDFELTLGWIRGMAGIAAQIQFPPTVDWIVKLVAPVIQVLCAIPNPYELIKEQSAVNIINFVCEVLLWLMMGVVMTIWPVIMEALTALLLVLLIVSLVAEECGLGEIIDGLDAVVEFAAKWVPITGAVLSGLVVVVQLIGNLVFVTTMALADTAQMLLTALNIGVDIAVGLGEDLIGESAVKWLGIISLVLTEFRLVAATIFLRSEKLAFHVY